MLTPGPSARLRAGGAKFADAVSKLLSKDAGGAASPGGRGGSAPILSRSRSAAARSAAEAAERSRLKAARKRKRELKSSGHAPPQPRGSDPAADALERSLLVTATRGVVTLFNAVAKAQKARREAGEGSAAATAVPKAAFLRELRRAAAATADAPAAGAAGAAGAGAGARAAPAWDVLRDDFAAGGGRLRSWDRGHDGEQQPLQGGSDDDGDDDDAV